MNLNIKKIFISLLIFAGLAGTANAATALLVSQGLSNSNQIGSELIVLLLDLKGISLNGDIFSSEAFINLHDFSIEIVSQPVGRANPFSKIGE